MELNRPLSIVTPTLDGDILALLARADAAFTVGQIRRILTRHSATGIRKTLGRLVKQGTVLLDRAGNGYVYRFNRKHIAAKYIIGLARLQELFLKRLENLLASWEFPPVYAAIFGSAARDSMTVDSDLDLLLIKPDNVSNDLWNIQVDKLASEVSKWIGNDVRPLQFTVSELASLHDEPVLNSIAQEGITVSGNHSWLVKQLRKVQN